MAITDLYEAVDWTDTEGPGCGNEGHEASCLCDVDLAAHPVPPSKEGINWAKDVGCGAIATKAGRVPTTSRGLVDWAAEMLGASDKLAEAGARFPSGSVHMLEELRSQFLSGHHGKKGGTRYEDRGIVGDMLAMNLSITAVANYLDTTPTAILRLLTLAPSIDVPAYLRAEEMLRADAHLYSEIARATGLELDAVRGLAKALGIQSTRRRGSKIPVAIHAQILQLRAEGKSYSEIARLVGVNRNAAITVVRRAS